MQILKPISDNTIQNIYYTDAVFSHTKLYYNCDLIARDAICNSLSLQVEILLDSSE